MTAADWAAGVLVAGALWGFAIALFLKGANRRRARDRRELRRSAEAAYREMV